MKIILVCGLSLFFIKVTGQGQRDTIKLAHGSWEIEAYYPGGTEALKHLFSKEMRYPARAKWDKIEGGGHSSLGNRYFRFCKRYKDYEKCQGRSG